MVQDKSTGGLGIRLPCAISAGSVIALVQGFTTSFGVVRHCSKSKGQFFIGVEYCALEEGTQPVPSAGTTVSESPAEQEAPVGPTTVAVPVAAKADIPRSKRSEDFAMLDTPPSRST